MLTKLDRYLCQRKYNFPITHWKFIVQQKFTSVPQKFNRVADFGSKSSLVYEIFHFFGNNKSDKIIWLESTIWGVVPGNLENIQDKMSIGRSQKLKKTLVSKSYSFINHFPSHMSLFYTEQNVLKIITNPRFQFSFETDLLNEITFLDDLSSFRISKNWFKRTGSLWA